MKPSVMYSTRASTAAVLGWISSAMSDRSERLHQFFAGYFNQDWDVNGAANWSEVLDEYIAQNGRDDVLRTRDDLRVWLSETAPGQRLPGELGCEYDPRLDGMDDWSWARAMAEYLDARLGD